MRKLLFAVLLLAIGHAVQASDCSPKNPESFDSFLQRFSTEHKFAIKRTVFPLRMLRWEFGLDEKGNDVSGPEKWSISRSDYSGWPSLGEVMKENKQLASEVSSNTGSKAILEVFQPNTDWGVLFHFRKQNGCWFFWQYEDRSL